MQVYFYKASYASQNVYKLSDFFSGNVFTKDPMKMLDLNIAPSDGGFSYTTKQLTLPDGSSIRNYTHIYIPSLEKVYMIVRFSYLNKQQVNVQLVEDAFIAKYQEFKSRPFNITRTNDPSNNRFKGVLDTSAIGYTYNSTLVPVHKPTHTGKWLLFFVKHTSWSGMGENAYSTIKLRLNIEESADHEVFNVDKPSFFDSVDTLSVLLTKYPEVVTSTPENIHYFNKRVSVGLGSSVYQCMYYGGALKWKKIKASIDVDGPISATTNLEIRIKSPDLSSKFPEDMYSILAFPYENNMAVGASYLDGTRSYYDVLVTAEALKQIVVEAGTEVIDTKLVDESILFDDTTSISEVGTFNANDLSKIIKTFNNRTTNNYATYPVLRSSAEKIEFVQTGTPSFRYSVMIITGFNTQINASLPNTLTIPTSYEPFTTYTLNIYGNPISIPANYVNNTRISFSVGIGVVNFSVYGDASMTTLIASGSFTLQTKYSIDKLDMFFQQNPTYKEQFAASTIQKVLGVGVGAGASAFAAYSQQSLATKKWGASVEATAKSLTDHASGLSQNDFNKELYGLDKMVNSGPGLGSAATVASVGVGLAAKTVVEAGFAIYQNNLMLEGLSKQPDQMLGDGSNALFNMNNRYGIYWHIKTLTNQTPMLNEYYMRGFPTSDVVSVDNLTARTNAIYTPCKYFQGRLITSIGNPFITNEIDRKLQEGVIII